VGETVEVEIQGIGILKNKMTVKELFQAFESVTGEKEENEKAETTDPETNASTDNAETETTEASEDAEE
jgi:hypothetical protein